MPFPGPESTSILTFSILNVSRRAQVTSLVHNHKMCYIVKSNPRGYKNPWNYRKEEEQQNKERQKGNADVDNIARIK